jgi:hypothetical protein
MPATYSINNNTAYEAARLATIGDVLNQLPDNTNKLISPKDARDAIYSSWENSIFKQLTGSASIEYIGVDKNGLNNKILLGKKQLGGVDVLNSTLLNYSFNDTDIFFFNNKSGITPSNTKISFLAGTNSVLYPYAPYINSYQGTSSLHLEIVNQTGDITIDSSTGRVSINNVTFPTKLETASASNGQILKYYNGRLIWDDNTINVASIGSTNSVTNITGSPVLVNGHSLELTESSPIIATFGNIEPGQTFSNAPLVEVVRQMLYPHLGPEVSLLINANSSGYTTSTVAEFGNITPAGVQLAWSITKKSDPVIFATLSNSYLGGFAPTLPISYAGMTSISGVSLGYTPSISMDYTLSVYDSGVTNYPLDSMAIATGSSTVTYATASVTLDLVYPFFYGVNVTNATTGPGVNAILGSLTKLVEGKSDKIVPLSGSGYIYFIYPSLYGDIDSANGVFDENGFNISSSFTYSTYVSVIDSPSSYWSGISYSVYKHGPLNVGPLGDVNWEFNFGISIPPTTTTTTTAAPTTTTTTAAPTTTTTTTTAAPTTTTTTAAPTTTTTTTAGPTTTTTTAAPTTTTTTTAAPIPDFVYGQSIMYDVVGAIDVSSPMNIIVASSSTVKLVHTIQGQKTSINTVGTGLFLFTYVPVEPLDYGVYNIQADGNTYNSSISVNTNLIPPTAPMPNCALDTATWDSIDTVSFVSLQIYDPSIVVVYDPNFNIVTSNVTNLSPASIQFTPTVLGTYSVALDSFDVVSYTMEQFRPNPCVYRFDIATYSIPATTTTTTAAPTTTTTTAAPTTTTTTAAPTTTTTTTVPITGWDPSYKSSSITLSNFNLDADISVPGTASVLGLTVIKGGNKRMYSVVVNSPDTVLLGIGMTSSDVNDQIGGVDNNSIGVTNNGDVYYGGSATSLPGFSYTPGDVVDVAYDYNAGLMWIRVNGGPWNNDGAANPGDPLDPLGLPFSDPFTSSKFARPAASFLSGPNQISLKTTFSSNTPPIGYAFIY